VDAPARNTLDDGKAQAGLVVSYVFNDGGLSDYRIQQVLGQLAVLESETSELETFILAEYQKAEVYYKSSQEKTNATVELLELSKEIYSTAKQQVVSGRSTIAEILDAEMRVANLEIDLINAEADQLKALVQIIALTSGLHDTVGWSF
jgi:outer membrane protein TolC